MAEDAGYGVESVPVGCGEAPLDAGASTSLTEALGCTEVGVAAHAIPAGGSVELTPDRERLVVPLGRADASALGGTLSLPARGVGRVPADRTCRIEAETGSVVLVVTTTATGGATEPRSTSLAEADYAAPSTSDVATAHLTAPLGCAGLKANARRLEPGQAVPLHTEGTQEEVFVPLDDGGTMRVGEDTIDTPRGTVVRVSPPVPRSAQHDGRSPATWVMFGAPPTGGPTDWDPGASIVAKR